MNILLEYTNKYDCQNESNKIIDWIFCILKKHQNILKYQFKTFNIGLRVYSTANYELNVMHSHLMQWNVNSNIIDDKSLSKYHKQWKECNLMSSKRSGCNLKRIEYIFASDDESVKVDCVVFFFCVCFNVTITMIAMHMLELYKCTGIIFVRNNCDYYLVSRYFG